MLSVVVASVESDRSIEACLASIRDACEGLASEVLVVDASRDGTADRASAHGARVVRREPGTLVPYLWGDGIHRSRGRWVALTTGHCTVPPEWARALIRALAEGASGAGAGLRPNPGISSTDRAVFHLRYGAFLDLTEGEPRVVDDLPGDNVAYPGEDLRAFVAPRPDHDFWEIEYHARIRRAGGRLMAIPTATAGFGPAFPLSTILHHRYVHGQHHGGWRVTGENQPWWRVVLPSPLVPFVLLGRAARRAYRGPGASPALARAAAPFLALSSAWAAGEAVGALRAAGGAPRRRGRSAS